MADKMSRGAILKLCQHLNRANINLRLGEQYVQKIPKVMVYDKIYKEKKK